MNVDRELDRILTLLRNKIRECGFTQLEVQEKLGWGRSYISQLLTKQKSLRVEQVLMILDVIGVEPVAFYSELYHMPQYRAVVDNRGDVALLAHQGSDGHHGVDDPADGAGAELPNLVRTLVQLLMDKNVISRDELGMVASQLADPVSSSVDG